MWSSVQNSFAREAIFFIMKDCSSCCLTWNQIYWIPRCATRLYLTDLPLTDVQKKRILKNRDEWAEVFLSVAEKLVWKINCPVQIMFLLLDPKCLKVHSRFVKCDNDSIMKRSMTEAKSIVATNGWKMKSSTKKCPFVDDEQVGHFALNVSVVALKTISAKFRHYNSLVVGRF